MILTSNVQSLAYGVVQGAVNENIVVATKLMQLFTTIQTRRNAARS